MNVAICEDCKHGPTYHPNGGPCVMATAWFACPCPAYRAARTLCGVITPASLGVMTPTQSSDYAPPDNPHMITTYCTAGWSWHCACGAEGSGTGAPTQTAAYAYGEKHIRNALRKAREGAQR